MCVHVHVCKRKYHYVESDPIELCESMHAHDWHFSAHIRERDREGCTNTHMYYVSMM